MPENFQIPTQSPDWSNPNDQYWNGNQQEEDIQPQDKVVSGQPIQNPIAPIDYSKLSGTQNRALAGGLNVLIGDNTELFSTPIKSKQDLLDRGIIDETGKVTDNGILANTLIEKGLLNNDFSINQNGELFTKKQSEYFTPDNSETFLLSTPASYFDKNPDQYDKMLQWKKAKDLGLFESEQEQQSKDQSFSDTVIEKSVGFGTFLKNSAKLIQSASKVAMGFQSPMEEMKARTQIAGAEEGFVENAANSAVKQSVWLARGTNSILEKIGVQTPEQSKAQNTFNEFRAASYQDFFNKTKTVAALSSAVGVNDAADQLLASEQMLGKEQSQKIQESGYEVGAVAGDITNIELGLILKIGGAVIGGGSQLLNSVVNAKRIEQIGKMTAMNAQSEVYAAQATEAGAKAGLFSREAATAAELKGASTVAGDIEQSLAHASNQANWERQAAEALANAERNSALSQTIKETANAIENNLPPTFQSKIIDAGKLPVALPLKAAGFAATKFGDALASVDRGASSFLGTFGLDKYRGLARAASVFTGHINPASIAEGVIASNKLWSGAGRLLDSVGENMLVKQGTIPFFRRVAEDMATPAGKIFAKQLDNFIPPVTRGLKSIAYGVGKAIAPSLIYEAINNQGLDSNVFKQTAADALVFGGTHGVLKAATVGHPSDFHAAQLADRSNFNEKLKTTSPEQYDLYNSKANPSTKDIVSSFSAAYPNAEIKFTTEGPSFQSGNTATINLNNPASIIDSVLTHELKHVIQNIHQSDSLIIQKMVGDKTRKGEIFMKDGSIDPEFMKFGTEYNARMKAAGMPELGINDMAIEFFTDKAAEVLKSDIKSGRFTRAAQESQLSRKTKAIFSAIFTDVPIIKNLHITMGGAIDSSGRLVQGSGLVSEGLTQSKEVQAMVRKMYRESAGMNRESRSMATEGASTRQPRATKSTREGINNGTAAVQEANRAARAQGVVIPDGALDPSTARGRDGIPTPIQVKAIIDSGAIHPDHLGTFPTLVGNMTPDSTSTFLFHYKPAEQGRTTQSAAGETFHHVKPVGVRANKKGNILITGLDINLWDQNIKKVARSEAAKKLGYTEKQIREDSHEASKYHLRNETPNPYFEQKYGKAEALRRKSLIASTYGMMTESQRNFNPILSEIGMGRPDHVYRTFSLDDIKSATQTNESVRLSFAPNNYYALKVNLMPEAPKVDRLGNLIEDPQMKDFFENRLPNGERFRESPKPVKIPGKTKRIPQVTEAAQQFKEGKITSSEYNQIVDQYMPLEAFGRVLDPASTSDILRGLGDRKAGERFKKDMIANPENIPAGQRLESRLDIPAYENEGVYVNALHEPRKDVNKGGAGTAVAYTATTVMDNVNFGVTEKAAENIAAGKPKGTIATMQGDYVPMTVDQTYGLAKEVINNPRWTEVGMNPIRHSYFYDKATQMPVESAKRVVQIGALVLAEDAVKGQKSNYRYMPQSLDQQISMPKGIPSISKNQSRFLPEPIEKLSAFVGKRVQVLTSDLSIVGNIQHGSHTAEFKGGPGYLDNDGWGFTGKDAADAFATRWEKDGKPLIGLASLGPANHLNSLDARRAYGEKWKSLVESGEISKQDASTHIQEAMKRIANSDAKSIKPAWKAAAEKITDASTLAEYFDKIPWAAAPVFYDKLTAKTLKLPYKLLVEKGLDLESAAKEYRQPEFHGAELGDLYAIAEYNGSKPEYRPELNKAYPWRIEFSKKATLSEMHNVGDLTTDPRAFAGKQVGGRLGAQPLMVTGINLDRLMAGDLKETGKPLTLQPGTAKTTSNPAGEFGSGNPNAYTPYQEVAAAAPVKKSKVKTKSSAESISNVAKMK